MVREATGQMAGGSKASMHAARVVLGSLVVHAGLLGFAVRWLPQPVTIVPAPPHEDVIEIAIVPPDPPHTMRIPTAPSTAAPTAPRATIRSRSGGHAAAVGSISSGAAATRTEPAAHGDGAPNTALMHMRGPDLRPDGDAMETVAAAGKPAPSPPHESGRLDNAPNGKAVIHDAVTTVTVDKDGSAHFHDKPDIEIHVPIVGLVRDLIVHPDVIMKGLGDTVADWAEDPEAGKRYGRTQDLPAHLLASNGACDQWGAGMCDDAGAPDSEKRGRQTGGSAGIPLITGKADITAYLMRKAGIGDPFASRKLALLDATRDERAARGDKYRTEQLARSAELMRTNLERLWATAMTADERRAVLFELWDECAEGDSAIGSAGERARATVIGWIRAKHVAYPTDELAALNQRRASKQDFAP